MLDSIYHKSKGKRKTYAQCNKYYEVRNDIVKRRGDLDLILPVARAPSSTSCDNSSRWPRRQHSRQERYKNSEEQVYSRKINYQILRTHEETHREPVKRHQEAPVKGEDLTAC